MNKRSAWILAMMVAVGVTGYTLWSEGGVYADPAGAIDMSQGRSMEQLPKNRKIVEHPSGTKFAGTDAGLFVSRDGGEQWLSLYELPLPVTLITSLGDGDLYAFVVGKGLLGMGVNDSEWSTINNQMGAQVLYELSIEQENSDYWVATNQHGKQILSKDRGKNWRRADGLPRLESDQEKRGATLYQEKCQSCHGISGVGETYTIESLTDRNYRISPPLDESAHAWHHTDEALVKKILEGSSPPGRMPAWGTQGLTTEDATALVAYMKSLWSERIKACQGPGHMNCM